MLALTVPPPLEVSVRIQDGHSDLVARPEMAPWLLTYGNDFDPQSLTERWQRPRRRCVVRIEDGRPGVCIQCGLKLELLVLERLQAVVDEEVDTLCDSLGKGHS